MLDPRTPSGREGLQQLTRADVKVLRARPSRWWDSGYAQVAAVLVAATLLVWAPSAVLAQIFGLPSPVEAERPVLLFLTSLAVSVGLVGLLAVLGSQARKRLTSYHGKCRELQPVSADPALCTQLLDMLHAPEVRAYRDAVVPRRDLMRADARAMRTLYFAWTKTAEPRNTAKDCEELHSVSD